MDKLIDYIGGVAKGYVMFCLFLGVFVAPFIEVDNAKVNTLLTSISVLSIVTLMAIFLSFFAFSKKE
jgi:hypothetical protein